MKRLVIIVSILIMFSTSLIPVHTAAEEKETDLAKDAKAALLIERDSGEILYEDNAHEKLPPASMTKIMTLLLVMEALEKEDIKLTEEITISENASGMGGSQVFLETGEVISLEDLIKSVAIASGNDASVALAERIAGSEAAFVEQMNKRVTELKLENTHFENVSGLPSDNHYSTAYDMAIIAKELLKHEEIVEYTSIYEDYLRKGEENEFWLVNTNKLVRHTPYVDGLKTGYTEEAKYCLTATAKKDEMRVVSVVMGAENVKTRNAITMNLIDFAFNQYESEKIYDKGQKVAELSLLHTKDMHYDVVTSEAISLLHKKNEEKDEKWQGNIELNELQQDLPIKKGENVGKMQIQRGDKVVHESTIQTEEKIEKANFTTLWSRAVGFITKFHES